MKGEKKCTWLEKIDYVKKSWSHQHGISAHGPHKQNGQNKPAALRLSVAGTRISNTNTKQMQKKKTGGGFEKWFKNHKKKIEFLGCPTSGLEGWTPGGKMTEVVITR